MELGKLLGVGRQAEVYALDDRECVKLFYADCPEAVVAHEAERMRFVSERGVAAPIYYGRMRAGDREGIRMERLTGVTMLREALENPSPDADYGFLLGAEQRRYHQVQAVGLGDMKENLARQFGYTDLLSPAWREELTRLLAHMPDGDRLVHMDYHSDNLILTPQGPRVIDWTSACAGDPLADAARTLMTLEQPIYPLNTDERMHALIDDTRALIRERYLCGYGADVNQINAWKPFVAASRLFCCPEEERGPDLALVRELLG